ncbi:MAG: hypothetical protein ACK55I_38380, partial [bacterium]
GVEDADGDVAGAELGLLVDVLGELVHGLERPRHGDAGHHDRDEQVDHAADERADAVRELTLDEGRETVGHAGDAARDDVRVGDHRAGGEQRHRHVLALDLAPDVDAVDHARHDVEALVDREGEDRQRDDQLQSAEGERDERATEALGVGGFLGDQSEGGSEHGCGGRSLRAPRRGAGLHLKGQKDGNRPPCRASPRTGPPGPIFWPKSRRPTPEAPVPGRVRRSRGTKKPPA